MSSRTPNTHTTVTPDAVTDKKRDENNPTVTTKYDTNISSDDTETTQPDCFTENENQLRKDFIDISTETTTTTTTTKESTTSISTPSQNNRTPKREVTGGKTYKYADLISKKQIESIEEMEKEPTRVSGEETFVAKGTFHSEIRFLERGELDHEDAPKTIQKAWETGVQVGVEHFDRDDFYGYKRARYNEVADIVMLMNDDGIIETALSVFEESMTINTDHLHRCENSECGRLYDVTDGGSCCHWCGYSKEKGTLPREETILPQKRTTTKESTHTLNTTCDDCGEVFDTLTRLRLHNC